LVWETGHFVPIIGDANASQFFIAGVVGNLINVVMRADEVCDGPGGGER
jgi:hypothetical protein